MTEKKEEKLEINLSNVFPYMVKALSVLDNRTAELEKTLGEVFTLLLKIHGKKRTIEVETVDKPVDDG